MFTLPLEPEQLYRGITWCIPIWNVKELGPVKLRWYVNNLATWNGTTRKVNSSLSTTETQALSLTSKCTLSKCIYFTLASGLKIFRPDSSSSFLISCYPSLTGLRTGFNIVILFTTTISGPCTLLDAVQKLFALWEESAGSVHLHAWICVYEPGRGQGDSKLAKYGSRGSGFLAELIIENGEFHLQVSDWIWSSLSLSALYDYLVDRSWDLGLPPKILLFSKCSPSLLVAHFHMLFFLGLPSP